MHIPKYRIKKRLTVNEQNIYSKKLGKEIKLYPKK